MSEQSSQSIGLSRNNNFDVIRLFAAFQVVLGHFSSHLRFDLPVWMGFLSYFPGVPIFFIVSGYLISAAYERSTNIKIYLKNRLLRIYPALWICLLISTTSFLIAGFRGTAWDIAIWILSQLSIAQFYNPEFLRSYGVGVLNGSLWSIPVEMQFYLALPILVYILGIGKQLGPWLMALAVSLLVMLLCRNQFPDQVSIYAKIIYVSLLPYLFYFLVGVVFRLLCIHFNFFEKRFVFFLAIYGVVVWCVKIVDAEHASGNALNPVQALALGAVVISAAFTRRTFAEKILRANDISYGVYIYHMPVANALLFWGIDGVQGFMFGIPLTIFLATLSWIFVERPSLRLKGI
jgi:peptidoglycan/LPS O-acetylase OafA/YrhL